MVKVVPHTHNVGTHDRCGTTVEPMIKQQWFVKMDDLDQTGSRRCKGWRYQAPSRTYGEDLL